MTTIHRLLPALLAASIMPLIGDDDGVDASARQDESRPHPSDTSSHHAHGGGGRHAMFLISNGREIYFGDGLHGNSPQPRMGIGVWDGSVFNNHRF